LGPFIMASVNHSPARNKKTTTALFSDLPNDDSRGRTAGCSLMSMPKTKLNVNV